MSSQNEADPVEQFPDDLPAENKSNKIIITIVAAIVVIVLLFAGYFYIKHEASNVSTKEAPKVAKRDFNVLINGQNNAKQQNANIQRTIKSVENLDTKKILQQLDSILLKITSKNKLNKQVSNNALKAIQSTVMQIKKDLAPIDNLQQQIISLNLQMKNNDNNLSKYMNALLKKFPKNNDSKEHQEPPFILESIEIWDNKAVATINLSGKRALLSEGDSRIGWRIISINFDADTIEIYKQGITLILETQR